MKSSTTLFAVVLLLVVCAMAQLPPIPPSKTGVDLTNTVPGDSRPAVLKFGMAGDSNEFVVGCYDTSGIDMAFKEINDKGGAKGTKLELVFDYVKGNVATDIVQALYKQVVFKDVFAFVQTTLAATHYVHAALAKPFNIPMLNPITGAQLEERESIQLRAEVTQVGHHLLNMGMHGPAKCTKYGIVSLNIPVMHAVRGSFTEILTNMGLDLPAFTAVPLRAPANKSEADQILDPLYTNSSNIPHCIYLFASNQFNFWMSFIRRHPKADPDTSFYLIPIGAPIAPLRDAIDGSTSWFKNKVFIVQAFSHPMHPTSQLAAEFRAALAKYTYGPNRTKCPNTPTSPYQFEAYAAGRLVGEIVSRMTTFSREDFMKTVYETKMFKVSDLVVGPYTDRCEGLVTEDSMECFCNAGSRTVYAAELDENGVLVGAEDDHTLGEFGSRELRIPLQRCFFNHVTESVPTVTRFGTVHTPAEKQFADLLMRHVVAYNRQSQKSGRMHRIYAVDGTFDPATTTASAKAVRLVDRYDVSAFIGGAKNVPATVLRFNADLPSDGQLPTAEVPFDEYRINFVPRLQEYIHALVAYAQDTMTTDTTVSKLHVVADTAELGGFARKSVETFTRTDAFVEVPSDIAAGITGADATVMLLVVASSAANVKKAVDTATANPDRRILIAASEDHLLEANPVTQNVSSNIHFTSIFPAFWRSDASPFAQAFFSDEAIASPYLGAMNRTAAPVAPTPMELRAALQAFLFNIAADEKAKSPAGLKKWLYQAGARGVFGVSVGPMSSAKCDGVSDDRCECNNAMQQFHVHNLKDWFTVSAPQTTFSYTHAGCRVAYEPLTTNEVSAALVAAIAVASVVVVAASAVAAIVALTSGRNTSAAPKDPDQPFAIVFTDIQSSTTLWAEVPEAMSEGVETHHTELRKLISQYNGYEVKTIGDAFMVAFKNPYNATRFALGVQNTLLNVDWGTSGFDEVYKEHMRSAMEARGKVDEAQFMAQTDPSVWKGIRVRVGVHYGTGSIQKDEVTLGYDYYGTVVNTAARVESVGNGGQVLLTEAAYNAVFEGDATRPEDVNVVDMGPQPLRGLNEPVRLFQCTPKSLSARKYPPLRIDEADDDGDSKLDDDDLISTVSGATKDDLLSSTHTTSDGDYDAASREAALAKLVRRHWKDAGSQQVATSRLHEAFTFIMGTMTTSSGTFRREFIAQVAKAWRVDVKIDTKNTKAASGAKEEAALLSVLVKVLKSIETKERKRGNDDPLGGSVLSANGALPTPTNKDRPSPPQTALATSQQ